ncbi:MAG: peptidoglycan DD-metalloendopeptidase family protein [Bacteroidales bacterium]|nr:peptidoglycan DD-metalloendopeptidase family protein [Bacteroidales bacterium]
MTLLTGAPLYAQDTKTQESKRARLEKEIAVIDKQIRANDAKSRDMLAKLGLTRSKIKARKELIEENKRQIDGYDGEIAKASRVLEALRQSADSLEADYRVLVRAAYKNRNPRLWFMYILASEDLPQAYRRYAYFKEMASRMRKQADELKRTQENIETRRNELVQLRSDAAELRSKQQKELSSLNREESQNASLVASLKKDNARYRQQLNEKQKQVQALNREIERLIAEASGGTAGSRTSGSSRSRTSIKIDEALSADFARNKGRLPWPAEGYVTEKFGQHPHPVFQNVMLPFNNGVGIAVEPGTKARAVFGGTVKQIVVMPGYNQCVLVQHGSYFTFYCKLGSCNVKPGAKIKTGEVIGSVDTIDGQTLLHFQLWQGQQPQDPELWLK